MLEEDRALLERFKPRVMYDSLEAFFADSAEQMAANPGVALRAGPVGRAEGEVICDASTAPPLSLDVLAKEGGHYANGLPVQSADRFCIKGKDYRTQYSTLIAQRPDLRNRVYGCVHRRPGKMWLQYWFFYFYDDPALARHLGAHEGDWEMIQLRIPDGNREPDQAVYAAHNYATCRPWPRVDKVDGRRPVVYSARGSHASYFEPGVYDTKAWLDIADGGGPSADPELTVIDDDGPAWALWPGRWGDTAPRAPWLAKWFKFLKGAEADSPAGPHAHDQWSDPDSLFNNAKEREDAHPAQPLAKVPVRVDRLGPRLRVAYNLGRATPRPIRWLVVNVTSDRVPPRSFTVYVGRKRKGRWIVPWLKLDPDRKYEVRVSLMGEDKSATAPTCTELVPESRRWHRSALGWVGEHFAKFVQLVRGIRMRWRAARRG